MGYRIPLPLPPDNRRHISDVATGCVITVDNGSISRISIPCFYRNMVKEHDRMEHDHYGWPQPSRGDRSCQMPNRYSRIMLFDEIDLPREGYDSVEICLTNAPDGLSVNGYIDYNTITIVISSMCESANTVDIEIPFSAYAIGSITDHGITTNIRDVITKGIIKIIAGQI